MAGSGLNNFPSPRAGLVLASRFSYAPVERGAKLFVVFLLVPLAEGRAFVADLPLKLMR